VERANTSYLCNTKYYFENTDRRSGLVKVDSVGDLGEI